jgi:hypothetical protein
MAKQTDLELHSESDWGLSLAKVQDGSQDLEAAYSLLMALARFAGTPQEQRFAGAAAQEVAAVVDAAKLATARIMDAARVLAALDRAKWDAENP